MNSHLLGFAPELVFGRRRRGCVLIRLAAAREVQLVRQRRVVRVIERYLMVASL